MTVCLLIVGVLGLWILYKVCVSCCVREVRVWRINSITLADREAMEVLVGFKATAPKNALVMPDSARFKGKQIIFSKEIRASTKSATER
jgi:hypothetical protein